MRQGFTALISTALLSFTFASGALAADMPVKARPVVAAPVFNWTGFYFGGTVGAAWQHTSTDYLSLPALGALPADPFRVNGSHRAHFSGGVHAGYNYQFSGKWVAGVEADFSLLSNSANRNVRQVTIGGVPIAGDFITTADKTDWLASARARLGYAMMPNWLVYGTLGGAWSRQSFQGNEISTIAPVFSATAGNTHKVSAGVAAGGGFEYAMTQHIILRAEYLYYGVDKTVTAVAPCVGACLGIGPDVFTWRTNNIQQARAGVSYKF
jgi:outer membrane immunogenic protein